METDYHFFQFLFHNKKKYIFITLFFFINIALHAYSKQINSLSLSFIRSEYSIFSQNQNLENYLTSDNHSEINSITGKITYIKNPFLFIFETTSPVQQIVYINETAAYLLDDDTIYEIPDNYNDIYQTCSDFLAWFTDDYNLGKANFVISEPPVLSDNQLLTTWIYSKNEPHPIDKVYSYSNSKKQITKLQMFVDSSTLITQTDFKKYDYFCGYSFPIEIETTSFDNQQIIAQSKLTFSNISFNSLEKSDFTNTNIHLFIEQNDISKEKQITPLNIPESNIYTVSIPSVLVTKGYSLYKKFITNQDMTNCPFYPSCSQYMLQAISKNGVFGFIQGLERLKRCTSSEHKRDIYPLTENGKHYDPVP